MGGKEREATRRGRMKAFRWEEERSEEEREDGNGGVRKL